MLHPFYALREGGYEAEYSAHLARIGTHDFLSHLPCGENEYVEGVRRMYGYLYERALAGSGKHYFLDKTPRYYFVITELYETFPDAYFVILLRNPLAVLCSIIGRIKGNWLSLVRSRPDLIDAPLLLLEGMDRLGERAIVVHYEKMLKDPEGEIDAICKLLGTSFVPEMINYGRDVAPQWRFGDKKAVHTKTRPDSENAEKWVEALSEPQVWRLADDYLRLLGRETIERMGYCYEELEEILRTRKPDRRRLFFTFSLAWLLKKPIEQLKWRDAIVGFTKSSWSRGIKGLFMATVRRLAYLAFIQYPV